MNDKKDFVTSSPIEDYELLRVLLDNIPDSIYFKDDKYRFVIVNRAKASNSGTTPDEMIGRTDFDYIPEEQAKEACETESEIIRTGRNITGRIEKRTRKDGNDVWISATKIPWRNKNGDVIGTIGISRDITDLKHAKEALQQSNEELEGHVRERTGELTIANEKLLKEIQQHRQTEAILRDSEERIRRNYHIQTVVNSILKVSLSQFSFKEQLNEVLNCILSIPWLTLQSKGCIFLVDAQAKVLRMHVQYGLNEKLLQYCEIIPFGKCLCGRVAESHQVMFSDHIDTCHDIRFDGMEEHGHYCVPVMNGEELLGVINLYVDAGHKRDEMEEAFLLAVANTTASIIERNRNQEERLKLQCQLMQSEKLSALGRLSANVAHEIRNPLTVLGGFARRLNKIMPEGSRGKEYAEVIFSEASRLEIILKNVLSYSKDTRINFAEVNPNLIVEESLRHYKELCDEKSIKMVKATTDVPKILADKSQVRQVLDNLISNGIDAMPEGGEIVVVTDVERVDKKEYVVIKVKDRGAGIPQDKLNLIFEPFFSTKEMGRGTGLGLSISRKIVEEHSGFILAESAIGKGSTFKIYFPMSSVQ
ncbi:MAG: PAS domain-containing protein [Nitrospirae bacterium]|nr:PAS domain-containing protein [Nitrospirota bacterium]